MPDRGEPIFAFYRFRGLAVIFSPIGPTPNLSFFVAAAQSAIRKLDAQAASEDELVAKLVAFASPWGLSVRRSDRRDTVELEVERR